MRISISRFLAMLIAAGMIVSISGGAAFAETGSGTDAPGAVEVGDFNDLKAAITAAGAEPVVINVTGDINVTEQLTISAGQDITIAGDCALTRDVSYKRYILYVEGALTLKNISVDGNKENITATKPLLYVGKAGTVRMDGHAALQNNITVNASGGAVYIDGGSFTMNSNAVISQNQNKLCEEGTQACGGGVYNNAGTFIMNGNSAVCDNEAKTGYVNSYGYGGGVYNTGTFIMNDEATVSGNLAKSSEDRGGGVYNAGTFIMNGNTHVKNNEVSSYSNPTMWSYGGGVYNDATFTMNDNSCVSSNSANAFYYEMGGGIYNSRAGIFTMNGSSAVAENIAYGYTGYGGNGGGGIYNAGQCTMNGNSTITANETKASGGGIHNTGTFIMKEDAAITNNKATDNGRGGGAYNWSSGTFTMGGNSTISENSAGPYGGGVCGDGTVEMSDTASITGNRANTGGGAYDAVIIMKDAASISNNRAYGSYLGSGGGGVSDGTITMEGNSKIIGNYAYSRGGGVFESKLTISGSAQISGNEDSSSSNNVYLDGDNQIVVAGPLTADALIGVTVRAIPTATNPVVIAVSGLGYTMTDADRDRVLSDKSTYLVKRDEAQLLLTAPPKTYAVQYSLSDGGTGKMPNGTATEGIPFTFPDCTFNPPAGKEFDTWAIGKADSDVHAAPGDTYIFEDSTIVYALWKPATYTVSFGTNGGTLDQTDAAVVYDGTYGQLPTPTRRGYTFAGWWTAAEGGAMVTEDTTVSTAGDHALYAHWTPKSDTPYTVKHYQQNASGSGYTLHETETLAGTTEATATAVAKTYTGFAENTTYEGRVLSGTIAGDGSLVLALYYDREVYTVSFDAGEGTLEQETMPITYGAPYGKLPTPTCSGYDFAGWWTEADGGTKVTESTIVSETGDHTLYAHWRTASASYPVYWPDTGASEKAVEKEWSELLQLDDPEQALTRAQAAYVFSVKENAELDSLQISVNFVDVTEGTEHSAAIAWADANGVMIGYDNGYFGPEDYITREQLALVLYRIYGNEADVSWSAGAYIDADNISWWAAEAMRWAVSSGLLEADNGELRPRDCVTGVEITTVLQQAERSVDNEQQGQGGVEMENEELGEELEL